MSKALLGDVALERRESVKEDADKYPSVGLEHLAPGEIELTSWDTDKTSTFTKLFRKGDVLFGRRRAYLKKAVVAPFDGICSGDITVIEAKEERILPELLPFVIQNDDFFDYAVEKSAGSLSPRVKWQYLKGYEFELPSIEEQSKLAQVLWSIEDTKKAYKRLIKAADELVKSQFIEMFGLPNNNIKNYPMGIIGDVVSDIHYGTSAKASDVGDYIYLRMNNITYDGMLDLTDVKRISMTEADLDKYSVKYGDVLFNRTNSRDLVGKTCVFNEHETMIIAGYIIRLRMKDIMLPEYFSYFMNTQYAKALLYNMAKGAVGQANINAKELQNIHIIIPPIQEQQMFVDILKQSDQSKFELEQALNELNLTYKCILADNLG